MSIKHNEPKFTDAATMSCRGAVEHRATWMALLYEQAKKQGADAEKMCREAIENAVTSMEKHYTNPNAKILLVLRILVLFSSVDRELEIWKSIFSNPSKIL